MTDSGERAPSNRRQPALHALLAPKRFGFRFSAGPDVTNPAKVQKTKPKKSLQRQAEIALTILLVFLQDNINIGSRCGLVDGELNNVRHAKYLPVRNEKDSC